MSAFRSALAALDAAGVPHCVRNGGRALDALAPADDLDVLVSRDHLPAADAALLGAGLHRLRAPGHPGHRFYVAFESGDWRKIDVVSDLRYGSEHLPVEPLIDRRVRSDGVWVVAAEDEQAHRQHRAAGRREPVTLRRRLARKRPAGLRRRGPVVAVLGPDGAGKGSTLDGAERRLPVAVTRVYLGNQRSSPSPALATRQPASGPTAAPSALREAAFLVRKALPVWQKLATAYAAAWRGHVVLCDRHPVEVLAVRPRRTPMGAALERALFARLVPRPDRIVVLDAPGEVLHARKGEHDPQTLERWRQGYLRSFVPPGVVVPTTGPVEQSVSGLLAVLWEETSRRNSWPTPGPQPGDGA